MEHVTHGFKNNVDFTSSRDRGVGARRNFLFTSCAFSAIVTTIRDATARTSVNTTRKHG